MSAVKLVDVSWHQKFVRWNPKHRSQTVDDENRRVPDASFNAADIGPMQFGLKSKLLLGQA